MTKAELVEKGEAAVKHTRTVRGEAEAAEVEAFEKMTRQPSPAARVEWMRRLTNVNRLMVLQEVQEHSLAQVKAATEEQLQKDGALGEVPAEQPAAPVEPSPEEEQAEAASTKADADSPLVH